MICISKRGHGIIAYFNIGKSSSHGCVGCRGDEERSMYLVLFFMLFLELEKAL